MSVIISIHAPLTGSDVSVQSGDFKAGISIHAPLTGSDVGVVNFAPANGAISIHAPLTGSDGRLIPIERNPDDFNPRSPYGERPGICAASPCQWTFQSTLPLRGATITPTLLDLWQHISIHAPLTGSDYLSRTPAWSFRHFNPRSPYGERR